MKKFCDLDKTWFFTIFLSLHFCGAPVQLTMTADRLLCDVMWRSFRNLTCRIVHKQKANIEIFTEMSSIEDSLSETESSQFGSEDEKIEIEGTDGASNRFEDDSLEPYADEPLADEEWLENYRREQAENEELEKELTKRLNNSVRVADW